MLKRIDSSFFSAWSIFVVTVLAVIVLAISFPAGQRYPGVILALAASISFFWFPAVVLLNRSLGLQYEAGVEAIKTIKDAFLTQKFVDAVLQEKAIEFDKLCRGQILLQEGKDTEDVSDLVELSAVRVREAKKRFWAAHDFAEEMLYKTRPKVGDYLKERISHDR